MLPQRYSGDARLKLPTSAMTELFLDRFDSPVGDILLVSDGKQLNAVDYGDYEHRMLGLLQTHHKTLKLSPANNPGGFSDRLRAYFSGALDAIEALPVDPAGTEFQQQVWRSLLTIPCGEVWSYGQLAQQLGKPGAARAVGLANSKNPISIVVPCHRVVGANGKLTGYAGGLERKRWLLNHEGATLPGTGLVEQPSLF